MLVVSSFARQCESKLIEAIWWLLFVSLIVQRWFVDGFGIDRWLFFTKRASQVLGQSHSCRFGLCYSSHRKCFLIVLTLCCYFSLITSCVLRWFSSYVESSSCSQCSQQSLLTSSSLSFFLAWCCQVQSRRWCQTTKLSISALQDILWAWSVDMRT